MGLFDKQFDKLGDYIAGKIVIRGEKLNMRDYFNGEHPDQLKVKSGQYDDNFATNYIGLAISRSVSRLFNGGIEFKLPKGSEKQKELLDQIWDANKEEQLLYQLGLNGAVYGTPFVKIQPGGTVNKITGERVDRLIALDPEITTVIVNPFDVDEAEQYVIEFTIGDGKDKKTYREVTRHLNPDDLADPESFTESWIVEHFIMDNRDKWLLDPNNPPVQWPYDFPPIIHWKNLPALKKTHGWRGMTDAEWAIGVQNKLNFADSNINKTIRLNAAPPTVATGVTEQEVKDMTTGPGSLFWTGNKDAKIDNLTANADITGSMSFAERLEAGVFELMREIPPSVTKNLPSGLTNFIMRVMYSDAIQKNDTKREMYGDAILEINRRLLVLSGFEKEASNPGMIQWGADLPTNPTEQIAEDTFLLTNKLDSKKNIAMRHGVDYEAVLPDILQEAADAAKQSQVTGGNLLRDFMAGKNTTVQ